MFQDGLFSIPCSTKVVTIYSHSLQNFPACALLDGWSQGRNTIRFAWRTVPLTKVSGTFHSLFKVLFNFPSRYLFAIELLLVFCLRSSLPPFQNAIPSISTHCTEGGRSHTEAVTRTTTLSSAFPCVLPSGYHNSCDLVLGNVLFTRRY